MIHVFILILLMILLELLEEELYANERLSSRISRRKRIRLEDIFRPPVDICFCGSFQLCRDYATEKNRWVIVNLQDHTEFLSQCLNRDVWSNENLKNIVRNFFVFWQVSTENMEGNRFKTFYNVEQSPYVCIIDPRTGEHKLEIKNIVMKPDKFIKDFYMFLKENGPYPNSNECKKLNGFFDVQFKDTNGFIIPIDHAIPLTVDASSSQPGSSGVSTIKINDLSGQTSTGSGEVLLEKLTEEEQIELAIKKSLSESGGNQLNGADDDSDEDNEDVESFSDDDNKCGHGELSNKKSENYEAFLGSAAGA